MSENNLPESWVMTTLNSVGQIISGGTPSTSKSEYWGGEISWISPVDLSGYKDRYITKGGKSITELGLARSSAKLMPKGSVLFSSRAPIGYVAIANNQLCTNQGFKSIIPNTAIDNIYLYYFLKSAKKQAEELASGTTFKEISLTNFSSLHIPLPPLAEQHRIVAKIEELFSELDKGIETLKTAQQQLKVYRQAVLKNAFEGRLTNPDVKEGELPEGWNELTLGELINKIDAGKSFKCDERPPLDNEVGVLKVSAITWGKYDEIESKTVVDNSMINDRFFVKEKDFLISRANTLELVGAVVIAEKIRKNLMLSDKTLRIDFTNGIDKYYALYFLRSTNGRRQMQFHSSGNQESMRNIGQSGIRSIKIQLPDNIDKQRLIVQEIESRLSVCDKIEEGIQQGLQQAEALRQSILKKAFEGKLVPQDPNDEPASVLLARIKAEREASPEKKSRTRKAKA